jgi:hypothetical protein
MDTAMRQSIYAHTRWSNEKLFDAAAAIRDSQLSHAAGDGVAIFDLPTLWAAR